MGQLANRSSQHQNIMKVLALFACIGVAAVSAASVSTPSVTIDLYYEALCGGCHHFIIEQLQPAMQKLGKYIDVTIYPFGNAEFTERPDGGFDFECQHGEEECKANIQHNCMADAVKDQVQMVEILTCLEKSDDMLGNFQTCLDENGVDATMIKEIVECSTSIKGEQLTHESGVVRQSHKPHISYVPYVELDKDGEDWQSGYQLPDYLCNNQLKEVPE